MISIVRNRRTLVSMTGFRWVTGRDGGWCERTGWCHWRAGGRAAAAVTDARGMTKRGLARLPGRSAAGRTELAERLPASQRTFAGDVLRATTPLLPGTGGTGARKSGGETTRASPARRAGAATCDRTTARGEPIAVRRRLAYHL
jgi:hypothetical protein